MAYGLYIYKDLSAGLRLEIHRKDWTGAATEIRAMGVTPLSLVGLDNRGSDVLEPIIKSTLNIDIKDLGEIDFQELFTSYATRYKVLVFRNGVQVWGGYLTPDSYSQDLEYRTSINLVARDNLGLLDQLDFDYFNDDGDGMVRVADLITKAQEKIEWVMAPIEWYAQQYVDSNGTAVKDAYINARLFQAGDNEDTKTWWEVLETVLSSLGQQMRYVGDNKVYIVNVADLYEIGHINGSTPFDYAIGGAASMEITPSWRQLTVKQDFGLIDNAIEYEQKKEYFERIALEAGPLNNSIYRNNFFKYNSPAGTQAGYLEDSWDDGNIAAILQYDGPMFYNSFIFDNAKESKSTYCNSFLFELYRAASNSYAYLPFKVAAGNSYIFQADFCNNLFTPSASGDIDNMVLDIEPVQQNTIVYPRFAVRFIRDNGQILYLHGDGWYSAENIIRFKLEETGNSTGGDTTVTINILEVPDAGELQICFYTPEWDIENKGNYIRSWMVVMQNLTLHTAAYEDMTDAPGELEVVGVANEDGNTKEDVDITVGEVPSGCGDSMTYAGGLFDATVGHKALTGWHRSDNKGGVLHLSELIGRGFVHHFCAFRNVNDEKTGGKVLTGTVPFPDTSFFSKHFTIDDETYVVNAATMDMLSGTAEVELRQVLPYSHQNNPYEQNAISGGSGTSIGGGTSSMLSWGAPLESKRIYELPTATEEEAKVSYIVLDKNGNDSAQKYPASEIMSLANWFTFDEDRQAVRTKFNFYADGTLSQLGPAGSESGDAGALTLGSLTNVGAWADAAGTDDVVLFRAAGSSTWGMKRLSDIAAGGGGGGTYYHDQLQNLDYPDQHPIAAITGLQAALDAKLNTSSISEWALQTSKPDYAWDEILGKPTTLAGYGITDAATAEYVNTNLDQKVDKNKQYYYLNSDHFKDTGGGIDDDATTHGYAAAYTMSAGDGAAIQLFGRLGLDQFWIRCTDDNRQWKEKRMLWHSGNANLATVDWTALSFRGERLRLSNPDQFQNMNTDLSIQFMAYRGVLSATVGAKIKGETYSIYTGGLVQNTDLVFYTFSGMQSGEDSTIERMRIAADGTITIEGNLIVKGTITQLGA